MNSRERIKQQVINAKARAKIQELASLYEKITLQEDAYIDDPDEVVMPTLEFVKLTIEERIQELKAEIQEVDDEF